MVDDVRHDGVGATSLRDRAGVPGEMRGAPASGGAQIVALAEVAPDHRYPMLSRVESYWRELRGNRLVPARSEVDPRRIEDALEYAFILERIAPGMGRFRLAGMHLNDLMGMEVRGMPLTAFFDPVARKTVSAALEEVFSGPAIASLRLAGERGIGRPAIEGRLLLLPLKSDFGEVTRVLGCLATVGPTGRTPRRFTVTAARIRPLAGGTAQGPARHAAAAAWEMAPPMTQRRKEPLPVRREAEHLAGTVDRAQPRTAPASPQAGASQAPRPPRASGRPHLHLVKTDTE